MHFFKKTFVLKNDLSSFHQRLHHEPLNVLISRYHPSAPENRRPHLGQHVGQRRTEDGGDHHLHPRGSNSGLHHANGAEEEEEGAEAKKAQRWAGDEIMLNSEENQTAETLTCYLMTCCKRVSSESW